MFNSLHFLVGCILVGATAAIYSISFAAIIYNGNLSTFLDRGIGMTLIGAAVMAIGGGLLFSLSGTVSHPQDATAAMLAASAAHIATGSNHLGPDALFITTVALVALTGLTAAVAATALGYCRLSKIFRQFPFSVAGGFLAATGYLLLMGSIGLLLNRNIALQDLAGIFSAQEVLIWLPWIMIGGTYAVLARTLRNRYALPLAVLATLAGFFVFIAISPLSLADFRGSGLLLGPFPSDGVMDAYDFALLGQVDWSLVMREGPMIISVAGMVIVGGLLNLHGLNHLTREDVGRKSVDIDNDLKAIGVLNAVSSLTGGLVGYPAISTTVLGWRLGLKGVAAALSAGLVCVSLALFGTDVLGDLPMGLFAAIVAYLGFDLLYSWLWLELRRAARFEVAIVLGIVAGTATVGILEALAAGFVVAVSVRHWQRRRLAGHIGF